MKTEHSQTDVKYLLFKQDVGHRPWSFQPVFCSHSTICFHELFGTADDKENQRHVFCVYLSTSEVVFESKGWGVRLVLSDTSSSDWAMEMWWWREACSDDAKRLSQISEVESVIRSSCARLSSSAASLKAFLHFINNTIFVSSCCFFSGFSLSLFPP